MTVEQGITERDYCNLIEIVKNRAKAVFEVLTMRGQYFRDMTEQGPEIAKKMAYLVEQGHDAVFSENYRTTLEELTAKLEIESAKQLAKLKLEQHGGTKSKGSKNVGAQVSK